MANKIVIAGSTVSASQLKEFFDQIERGGLNGDHMQAVIEHRNPFERRSLAETIACLKDAHYLDTSFEGKEVHTLAIRPLTKKQALDEYRNSGGKIWIWDELEKNMPYAVPKEETLEVMIMKFNRRIESDEGLEIMDKFGVRPLSPEPFIQYGASRPEHQKRNPLVSLVKIMLVGVPLAPILLVDVGERDLNADGWGGVWGDGFRFPVVRK